MHRVKVEKFEGPLGLLLQLIEKRELEITEISLSKVTEEYLAYLRSSNDIPEEELADFLLIAAKLLFLKSQSILPSGATEEEGASLAEQLRMYKEFALAAGRVEALIKKKRFAFFRETPLRSGETGFFPPQRLTAVKIKKIFEEIIARLQPFLDLPRAALAQTMSIKEKINQICDLLNKSKRFGFAELLRQAQSRAEIIVSFLALLELMKQRSVLAAQAEIFEEIKVERI